MDQTDPLEPVRNDPEYKAWAARQADQMVPQLQNSTVGVTIVPDDSLDVDIDYALQLGMMIVLDKPILVVLPIGRAIPPKLAKVADVIIEGSTSDEDFPAKLEAALDQLGIQESE